MFTNNCLPKYLYGDKMSQDEQSDKNLLIYPEDVPNLSSIPSPSSSLASTKKLEWDSGADIGYNYDSVKQSRKSKSYPSLNMDHPQTSNTEIEPKKHSSAGAQNINTLDCIGEGGDSLKSPKQKTKPKSFKHSTPYYHRQTVKSCAGDGPNEKATSPISIHEIKDECLQTTMIHCSSKEVQTDFENVVDKKQIEDKSLQTNITDILAPQSMSSSSSKSGSFKYIPGSEIENIDNNSQSLSNETTKSGVTPKSTSYTTSSRRDETDSGSCSPLGQMISTQYSKNLIADIDKSLSILQKFIKSKDYSNDTKEHYAKKIVTKIINSRYSGDSESTSGTSNKNTEIQTPSSNKEDLLEDKNKSNESHKISDKSVDKKYIECGIQCDELNKKSQIISDRNNCQLKESLEKINALQTDLKNWRDAQTLSEKLFEARKTRKTRTKKPPENTAYIIDEGNRNYLIQHSKNERKRQLSWINNEISYLKKLQDLLQLKEQSSTADDASSSSRKTDSTITKQLNSFHEIDERISNLEDVEKKFNKEFGLLPGDNKSQDKRYETLDKLSGFLTNEQIKFILDHDVHNKPEFAGKFNLNSSYNSHKNSIYRAKVRPSTSKRTEHTSSSDFNPKTLSPVDAATQCSISKSSDSTKVDSSNEKLSVDTPQQQQHQEQPQLEPPKVDQSCSSSEYDESVIVDKENVVETKSQKPEPKPNPKPKFNKGGTAYFLTFEEESHCEYEDEERKVLEQVVVKIPKYHHSNWKPNYKSVSDKQEGCASSTLEEYLLKNRPNFVKNANWRWTQVRPLDSQEKNNLFTCHEMKEMTKKKYNNLPEIQEKVKNNKTQNDRKQNRFMAYIFSKKLQKKTLQGHICLPTCKNVMASD